MDELKFEVPELSLVAMVGASSSGKTTFARKHFRATEVLSSDFFRGMISDDENNQSVSREAFDLLFYAARKRLALGKLTVIDATSIQQSARKQILDLAREQNVHAVAIVMNLPDAVLLERNHGRTDHTVPDRTIQRQNKDLRRCIKSLRRDGFRYVYVLHSQEEVDQAQVVRTKLWNDRTEDHGPFDIIGDIHGCCTELEALLEKLGYQKNEDGVYAHPEGRKAVFLGDYADRGPRNRDVLQLVMDMEQAGTALALPGNHDAKLLKYLRGKNVSQTHGIDKTIAEMEAAGPEFRSTAARFLDKLLGYYILDGGNLVVSHAGLKQEYIGRSSAQVRDFCLYGEVTGETDEYGLPVRADWVSSYRGSAYVVYGHIATKEARVFNKTCCVDTGCVYGGKLTAFRWPEKELVDVPALQQYYEPIRPLEEAAAEEDLGDMLTVGDFNRRLHIETALIPSVDIHENNAAAALETMSRFAADPHWLIYLPPTMSPCETSPLEGYLEHPLEAFGYYRNGGVRKVVCEKKHMGSRCVIVLCRTPDVARKRFGVPNGTRGILITRTGRRFFDSPDTEAALLDRLDAVLTATGFWEDFHTDWVCLDTELMPWSEKAQGLLNRQYAPTGNAGLNGLTAAVSALQQAAARTNQTPELAQNTTGQNVDPAQLLQRYAARLEDLKLYTKAYQEYCWTVRDISDIRIAPFHILAVEGKVFGEETHVWHMETIRKYITGRDPVYMETPYLVVDTEDEESVAAGVAWWSELTGNGGEGMVVKPETYTSIANGKLLQPAVKCRGREYLRIIYGAEYLQPDHLRRLKVRSLYRKRTLALKEFSLGLEALRRFVANEPLYRVHECVFGVLALESEPVDPRL